MGSKSLTKFYKFFIGSTIVWILVVSLPFLIGASKIPIVAVDGSSTVYPITEAVAEEFQKVVKGKVRVTVGISGTGGGFKKFCNRETDISDASRPIKEKEVAACAKKGIEYIELPVAYDGIAVVVHPRNDWAHYMTVAELKKLWAPEAQGQITRWSQIRPGWPDKEIHLFGPGVDSGTYDYFTEAVVGKEHSSRGDYTSSEDDNVLVQGVASDLYALGFFGVAYYVENTDKLKVLGVDDENDSNGKGPIFPTIENINNGTYQPLARPIFIYVSKASAQRPEVDRFVTFYLKNAATLSQSVGYVPLPAKVYDLALKRYEQRITGSIFGGKGATTGVRIEDLLARELKEAPKEKKDTK